MIKYKHGKGGLSGVALLGKGGYLDTGLGTGPIQATDPGRITAKRRADSHRRRARRFG